jgi:hypothetical protein
MSQSNLPVAWLSEPVSQARRRSKWDAEPEELTT